MGFIDRIGIDVGGGVALKQAVQVAASVGLSHFDIQLDRGDNRVDAFSPERCASVRQGAESRGLTFGLHTLSAVNVADYSPFTAEAVDKYLRGYVDAADGLGASYVVVHAGYHFTADRHQRMTAGRERLARITAYAEKRDVLLLLENMNPEPEDAEVRYLASTCGEWEFYYEEVDSPNLGLSFSVSHANLAPEGIDGFLDRIPIERAAEVRLADSIRGGKEQHLIPGDGDIDFPGVFTALESRGFRGKYVSAFDSLEAMMRARTQMAGWARRREPAPHDTRWRSCRRWEHWREGCR